ncbi:MAG: PadR family transcriptional regulator [Candidatus Bathyarchaeota archaeon]|nr:PadR family transcriptional regulator [Candidatus Bathyarchaeota archaeon]
MTDLEETAESWSTEMRKGYTKLAVLASLSKKPLSGYDIIKEIEEETLGFWKPTAGGIYPILKEMEKDGYIKGSWTSKGKRRKKAYEITEEGSRLLEFALQKHHQIAEAMRGLFHVFTREGLRANPPLTAKTFNFFQFRKRLEEKPIDEQVRILKRAHTNMQKVIKFIDEKLEKLEKSR